MKTAKYIISIVVALVIGYFISDYIRSKKDNGRLKENQRNFITQMQDVKSNLTSLKFSNKELEDYLRASDSSNENVLKGLKDKIEANGIKLKNIKKIVATRVEAVDSTSNVYLLDSIENILKALKSDNKEKLVLPIEDKTDCFEIKAELIYQNGESSIEFKSRKYTDTLYHVESYDRKKWRFWFIKSKFLGKRIVKVKLFNNCGYSQTIILERNKLKKVK